MTTKNILQRLVLTTIALLLANFMGGLDSTIVNTALPEITQALDGISLVGWISSIFMLGTATTTILWSRLGERIGNKRTFQLSLIVFMLSSMVAGLAPNMLWLIIARAVMGISTGGMVSVPFIIYADLYPDAARRARALGWVTASFTLSTIIGPILGGIMVDHLSWRWIFFINLPFGILSWLLLQINYQEKRQAQPGKFDYPGTIILVLGLTGLLFGFDAIRISGLRSTILLGGSVLILIGFYWFESHQTDAIVPIRLLKNGRVQIQNLIMFLLNGSFIAYSVYAPMWSQRIFKTNAILGGATQIAGSILLVIGTQVTTRLMRTWSYKQIVLVGTTSMVLSCLIMFLATRHASYWLIFLAGAFEGTAIGLAFTPMQVSVQDGVSQDLIGISTTFSLLFRTLGEAFMAAVFGALLNLRSDLYLGLHLIMEVSFILALVAFCLNLFRKEPVKQTH